MSPINGNAGALSVAKSRSSGKSVSFRKDRASPRSASVRGELHVRGMRKSRLFLNYGPGFQTDGEDD